MKVLVLIISVFFAAVAQAQMPISVNAGSNNQTFTTCFGFVIDSGGQGGPGYGNNEDVTITVCPDTPGDVMSIVFNLFNLSLSDDNPAPNQTNVDYMYVYDGTSTSANSLGVYQGAELQGVVIHATPQNATGCLTFRFVSNSVGTGMFSASATCETPCNDPVAGGRILNGITSDSIRVCVGEVVNFEDFGSFAQPGFSITEFSWDFMDGASATGPNVSHAYDVPGHYRVQLFVTDDNPDNECVNNNLIDLQVLVATIPTFEGFPSDATICLGESIGASAVPDDYEVTWNGFSGYETIDDGCLPDTLLGVAQEIDILQTGFAAGTTITAASQVQSICLELEHSFMGDIVVYLTCPNGQSIMLHQQGGGGTQIGIPNQLDNVDCSDPTTQGTPFNYCFTPTATQTWVDWVNSAGGFGGTLPAGNYAPIQPISNLVGCPTNGIWTLTVVDNWAADDGTLFSFGLTLDPSLYPDLVEFTPQIGLGADSSYWTYPAPFATGLSPDGDVMTITPTAAGQFTYTYTVTDNFGCTNDSSFVLTVKPNPIPDAGPDITVCGGTPAQLNGSISGNGSGSPCPYTLNLHDSGFNGWGTNHLLVTINGVTTSYTVASGGDATFTVNIPHGANVTAQFQGSGGSAADCEYQILDPNGVVVIQQGQNSTPTSAPSTITADCFDGYVFEWSPSSDLNNAGIPNPIGNFQSPQTLTLTVYPDGHPLCYTTDQLVVTLLNSAYPGEDSTLTICSAGAPVDLFPLLGPGASVNGSWFIGNNNTPVTMPYDPLTMNPGVYKYRVDSAGCTSQATVTVTEINTTISSVVPTNAFCNSGSDGSALVTGTNFTSYSLNGNSPVSATSPVTIPNLSVGNYSVQVFGTSGCTDTEPFEITEPAPLQLDFLTSDTTICLGSSISISALGSGGSSAYTYSWTENGNPIGEGQVISITPPLTSNEYCVTLSEACGSPTVTQCMTVDNPQDIVPLISPDTLNGCFPITVNFTNTTNSTEVATTTVDFGDGQTISYMGTESFTHVYENPGLYTVHVTITSSFGCIYEATFANLIEAFDYPVANFNILPNNVSFFDPTVELINTSSSDVVSNHWSIPYGNPASATTEDVTTTFPVDEIGAYPVTLIVINENGCPDTITRPVNVISEVIFYAPNTFTPDGDEFNQRWNIVIAGIDIYNVELQVFNRWGEMIWESHDVSEGWDGTYQGRLVQQGTYTWKLQVKEVYSDKKYNFNGHIVLLR